MEQQPGAGTRVSEILRIEDVQTLDMALDLCIALWAHRLRTGSSKLVLAGSLQARRCEVDFAPQLPPSCAGDSSECLCTVCTRP